jgi:hypothetical protein
MGIPTVPLAELVSLDFESLRELVTTIDFDLTARTFPIYQERFREFFALNGIEMREPITRFGE